MKTLLSFFNKRHTLSTFASLLQPSSTLPIAGKALELYQSGPSLQKLASRDQRTLAFEITGPVRVKRFKKPLSILRPVDRVFRLPVARAEGCVFNEH